jgi:TetR/AcrR family transcriptional repressor of nem operon
MRKSKAETLETRKKIVDIAAREFRLNGIYATGVSEIMAAAGMTHGGFYRHFASKDQLVAEACAASMDTFVGRAESAAECGGEFLTEYIREMLSKEFRDDCLGGCTLVAVGSELARADIDAKKAASDGFRQFVDILAKQESAKDPQSARADAIFKVSAMIGAVTISKMMDDPALADAVLDIAKERIAGPAASAPKRRASTKKA